ncbi:MAG: GEVED domain-containing protein [Pseudoflavonifractor sp.]|nr:GEVED domain-containing protein [Alloprevotella sp.]MCM1117477.1 GEVED domain-containing protein [Pseudoflavonifractor sp.]
MNRLTITLHITGLAALIAASLPASAQSETSIDFASGTGFTAVGVYDSWPQSPFRTGELRGNCMITDADGIAPTEGYETPRKVLGAQRSRFGSNTFGAVIDLAEPFELTQQPKYVHVLLHRPVTGRVMLIGIGESRDFPENGDDVEQFWEMSRNTVKPDTWTDAVFAVKGSGNISIKRLVVVPECESPHTRTSDYAFYIASIDVNESSAPTLNAELYRINACSRGDNIPITRNDRHTAAISLTSSTGNRSMAVNQSQTHNLYYPLLDNFFDATSGEDVTPAIDYTGNWMHKYVYVDWDMDGQFDPSTELVSFNHLSGKDSKGDTTPNNGSSPLPSFTVPTQTSPGVYRIRYKVDWDCNDPAGNDTEGNFIADNGGVIADALLLIHDPEITVTDNQLNGEVLAVDGSKLDRYKAPYGKDFTIKMNPEKGFTHNGVIVKHGCLDRDSIVMENPQVLTTTLSFNEKQYTIAGDLMRGDVILMGRMLQETSEPSQSPEVTDGSFGQPTAFSPNTVTDGTFHPSTKWHGKNNGQSGAHLYNQGNASWISLPSEGSEILPSDATLWCVTGNDTDGYIIYNKEASPTMMLASPKEMLGTTEKESYARLKEPGDPSYIYLWYITPLRIMDHPSLLYRTKE